MEHVHQINISSDELRVLHGGESLPSDSYTVHYLPQMEKNQIFIELMKVVNQSEFPDGPDKLSLREPQRAFAELMKHSRVEHLVLDPYQLEEMKDRSFGPFACTGGGSRIKSATGTDKTSITSILMFTSIMSHIKMESFNGDRDETTLAEFLYETLVPTDPPTDYSEPWQTIRKEVKEGNQDVFLYKYKAEINTMENSVFTGLQTQPAQTMESSLFNLNSLWENTEDDQLRPGRSYLIRTVKEHLVSIIKSNLGASIELIMDESVGDNAESEQILECLLTGVLLYKVEGTTEIKIHFLKNSLIGSIKSDGPPNICRIYPGMMYPVFINGILTTPFSWMMSKTLIVHGKVANGSSRNAQVLYPNDEYGNVLSEEKEMIATLTTSKSALNETKGVMQPIRSKQIPVGKHIQDEAAVGDTDTGKIKWQFKASK